MIPKNPKYPDVFEIGYELVSKSIPHKSIDIVRYK